ncbi:uncharacterized protein BJX67DRAFT_32030 [Aspergillus lucknowensis]|uniref:Elongation factor 2 n=1 Tax=Aspergillus lucknowensis TaxID=176173 RepID=A0ABR4LY00_9EURO
MAGFLKYHRLESLPMEEVEKLTSRRENIRNISIISAVGNRRSCLKHLLPNQASPVDQPPPSEGTGGTTRTLAKEIVQSFCVNFQDTSREDHSESEKYLLNFIDDPDRPALPRAAALSLRITDGAIIVLDAGIRGGSQADGLLSAALAERNKVTVVLDIESLIGHDNLGKEAVYQTLFNNVHDLNAIIQSSVHVHGRERIDPVAGEIVFASLRHGWAVNIPRFAALYGEKFGIESATRLWGDNFFDPESKKWYHDREQEGRTLERGFDAFILGPLYRIYGAVRNNCEQLQDVLETLGIELDSTEKTFVGDDLLAAVMRKFLPVSDAALHMVCVHIPSPVSAQQYRVESLYQGPLNDEVATGIRNCDSTAPLMLYISRAIPGPDNKDFYLQGRVFSGTVMPGQTVRILPNSRYSVRDGFVENAGIIAGDTVLPVRSVSAGNIVCIKGIFHDETSSFAITTCNSAKKFRGMNFLDMAIIYMTMEVDVPADLPSLLPAMKALGGSNPYLTATVNDLGSYVLKGFDETQLQGSLDELRRILNGLPVTTSEIFSDYREGVKSESEEICRILSPNKKLRLHVKASPMSEDLSNDIENGAIHPEGDSDRRSTYLAENHQWTPDNARRKIWSFGPDNRGPNLLVDSTVAVQYVDVIRDAAASGFQWATREGPLCEEPLRSVRVDIMDVTMMADAVFRGGGQVIPAMRRAVYGSVLCASPFLYEPVYRVEIHVPVRFVGIVHEIVAACGGTVQEESSSPIQSPQTIHAYMHVSSAVGLQEKVSSATRGSASCYLWFDHWRELDGDFEETVRTIRGRKGLSAATPTWKQFHDPM